MGRTIRMQTADGPAEGYLAGSGEGDRPGILLHVDALGLRPRIEEMADRIASWGYVVLAPHAFHRDGRADELAPGGDLTDPAERERFMATAMPRVRALTPDRSDPDARVWVETLLQHATSPIGVVGYCMGARLAVRTAALLPDTVAAVGGFHGGGLVTDSPQSPHRVLAGARAEFCFGHADADPSLPPEAVAALGIALTEAGLPHANEVYAGARHGYTMADSAAYDEGATERHFAALAELFGRRLGRGPAVVQTDA